MNPSRVPRDLPGGLWTLAGAAVAGVLLSWAARKLVGDWASGVSTGLWVFVGMTWGRRRKLRLEREARGRREDTPPG